MSDITSIKAVGDPTAVVVSALAVFKLIPWPEVAAFLAAVYTLLRIIEWVWEHTVLKNRKSKARKRRSDDA